MARKTLIGHHAERKLRQVVYWGVPLEWPSINRKHEKHKMDFDRSSSVCLLEDNIAIAWFYASSARLPMGLWSGNSPKNRQLMLRLTSMLSPNLSAPLLGASFLPLIRLASLLADPLLRRRSFASDAEVRIDLIHRVVEGNSNLGSEWVNFTRTPSAII